MNHDQAIETFEQLLKKNRLKLEALTPKQGLALVLRFYKTTRADDCDLADGGDKLLVQWGVRTDRESGDETFQFNLTRQFMPTEADGATSQLRLTFAFELDDELEELEAEKSWCGHPQEIADLEEEIVANESYEQISERDDAAVTLEQDEI